MRSVVLLTIVSLFILSGVAALAQCPQSCPPPKAVECPKPCPPPCPKVECPKPCPPACPKPCPTVCPKPCPTTTCPKPCPTVCPKPCPQTCPKPCPTVCPQPCPTVCPPKPVDCPAQCPPVTLCPPAAQCPCPTATPGALGAGPGPSLVGMTCGDFDKAYIEKMYNQNVAIIALATEGIQRGVDRNIRDISGEIRTRRTSENVKLANWYAQMGCGTIPVDYDRVQTIVDSVKEPMGCCFDVAYAQQMIGLLNQSRAANDLVGSRAALCDLKSQANVAARHQGDEIFRLERWLCQKGANCG